jgi:hypothetical protein
MVCKGATCQPKMHIGAKSGEVPNHFSQPRYAHVHIMSYPGPTSGCSSSLPLPPSVFHSLSHRYLSLSHLPATCATSLHITSIPLHLSSACVAPTLSSVSSSIHKLSTWPSPTRYSIPSAPITSSVTTSVVRLPRKHPAQIQTMNVEAATSYRCRVDLSLPRSQ